MTRFWASAARVCWGDAGDNLPGSGAAIDKLKGRLGNDPFLFDSPGEGDVIADFGNLLGNDDGIQISAVGFGSGLLAGALAAGQFVARHDNVAQDANDRFVFRTSDTTLWFDADGKGGATATLLADLPAGAVVTAADILIV